MKIGIVGLGLIGGSIGLDLTKQGYDVVGVSRQQITCNIALQNQVVREASVDLAILAKTDLIFVCTPIAAILSTIERITPYLSKKTIITDVGSVKNAIVASATQLWANFVGSHPMAGTANQGIGAAEFNLFQDAPCVLTPVDNTYNDAIVTVSRIWEKLGCKIYKVTPEVHDQAVAWISHLPVMISSNLIASCVNHKNPEVIALAQQIASSGFRDTSRVGGGNVDLGLMMAEYNREQLLSCLNEYQENLGVMINYIERENWDELQKIFKNAQQQRPKFVD